MRKPTILTLLPLLLTGCKGGGLHVGVETGMYISLFTAGVILLLYFGSKWAVTALNRVWIKIFINHWMKSK